MSVIERLERCWSLTKSLLTHLLGVIMDVSDGKSKWRAVIAYVHTSLDMGIRHHAFHGNFCGESLLPRMNLKQTVDICWLHLAITVALAPSTDHCLVDSTHHIISSCRMRRYTRTTSHPELAPSYANTSPRRLQPSSRIIIRTQETD